MKKFFDIFYFICFTSIFFSCQKEELNTEDDDLFVETKAAVSIDALSQLNGIPVYIKLLGSGGNEFLSAWKKGNVIDAYNMDDESGRQKWYIVKASNASTGLTGLNYEVMSVGGTAFPGYYMSAWDKNPHFVKESSTKVTFELIPNTNNYYIKYPKNNQTTYLASLSYNSRDINFIEKSKTGGRDKWQIVPIEEFTLKSISYQLEADDKTVQKPSFIEEVTVRNSTAIQQSMSANFSRKASETSNFSETQGLSLTLSLSAKVGVPLMAESQLNTSVTTSASWTYGGSQTQEDSRSYNFPLIVPPHSTYKAKVTVLLYDTNATYVATYVGKKTGRQVTLRGKWNGIKAGKITYDITDETGKTVKTLTGIQHSPVVL